MPKHHRPKPIISVKLDPSALPKKPSKPQAPRAKRSKPTDVADEKTNHKRQRVRAPGASGPTASANTEAHEQPRVKFLCASGVVDRQAAHAIGRLLKASSSHRHGVSLKSLTLAPEIVSKKATHAVTCQVLKYLPVVKQIVEGTALLTDSNLELSASNKQVSAATLYVLVYELLIGQGIKQRGPAEHVVLRSKVALKQALQQLLVDHGVQTVEELLPQEARSPAVSHPRWARVNLIKKSVRKVLELLKQQADGQSVAVPEVDSLLPDVLAFPSGTDLHEHPLVLDGTLILQSKASCMPAHALAPGPGWLVVDCCAAPGNKTTHVAALLHGTGGRVIAFDKDAKRLQRLRDNVTHAGAGDIVEAQQGDFLALDPSDAQFAQVRGVILDPSCSGSGTVVARTDHLLQAHAAGSAGGAAAAAEASGSDQRVHQLSLFQKKALRHALKFPALERLVYSTCSIHAAENEAVVEDVLPDAMAAGFQLKAPFPAWKRRGLPTFDGSDNLIRTDPLLDGTDGFFLAVFERCGPSQTLQRSSTKKKKKK